MKQLLLTILIACSLISCKKDKADGDDPNRCGRIYAINHCPFPEQCWELTIQLDNGHTDYKRVPNNATYYVGDRECK